MFIFIHGIQVLIQIINLQLEQATGIYNLEHSVIAAHLHLQFIVKVEQVVQT
jgi:hypothetical protein